MTKEQQRVLAEARDIPSEQRVSFVEGRLRYEDCAQHGGNYTCHGVHTWHPCSCGRFSCRNLLCAQCWREVLSVLRSAEATSKQ